MKRIFTILLSMIVVTIIFTNCGGKGDVVEVKGLKVYEDASMGFSMKYPENWVIQQVPSARFLVFTSSAVKSRFVRYDAQGVAGAKIEILFTSLDSNVTMDTVIANKLFEKDYFTNPVKVTIDGVQATKQEFDFELEDGPFHGEVYYATKDNKIATTIYFEAFGGTFDEYKKSFDEILASVKLGRKIEIKKDTVTVVEEAEPPSQTLRTVSGEGYIIDIPDNFSKEGGMYLGKRRGDSYIKVESFDASKTKDFGKLVEENHKKLPGAGAVQNITINGEKAAKIVYTPSGKVGGEMYFVLKNKRLYRVTINWFRDEEKDFKPIFQKCVMTLKVQ